jgi:hypothetical protein
MDLSFLTSRDSARRAGGNLRVSRPSRPRATAAQPARVGCMRGRCTASGCASDGPTDSHSPPAPEEPGNRGLPAASRPSHRAPVRRSWDTRRFSDLLPEHLAEAVEEGARWARLRRSGVQAPIGARTRSWRARCHMGLRVAEIVAGPPREVGLGGSAGPRPATSAAAAKVTRSTVEDRMSGLERGVESLRLA